MILRIRRSHFMTQHSGLERSQAILPRPKCHVRFLPDFASADRSCGDSVNAPPRKKTPAIPGDRRGQVFRAGCVRGGVRLAYGILVGAAAGAGAEVETCEDGDESS